MVEIRWAVGPLMAIAMTNACAVAHAGGVEVVKTSPPWNLNAEVDVVKGQGTIHQYVAGPFGSTQDSNWLKWTNPAPTPTPKSPAGDFPIYSNITNTGSTIGVTKAGGSLNTSGNWKYFLRWTPSYTGELLPDYVSMLVTLDAGANTTLPDFLATGTTVTLSAGRNNSPLKDGHDGSFHSYIWSATSKELVRVSTKGAERHGDGSYTFEYDSPQVSAKVEVPAVSTTRPETGSFSASASSSIVQDNRSVAISSSNIDSSYKRTMDTGHPLSKYRNQTPPEPLHARMTAEIPAGLINERGSDGSMVADSAAQWGDPSNQWMGGGIYHANTSGFTSPQISWSLSGGDPSGLARDELASSKSTIDLSAYSGAFFDLNGIMLGGVKSGSGMMGVSTISLTAVDSDGVTGDNTYTVNWHLPYEWKVNPNRAKDEGYDWSTQASDWTTANALTSIHINAPAKTLWASSGSQTVSGILSGGSVYIGSGGGAALGMSNPYTAGIALLLFAASVTVLETAPPDTSNPFPDPIPINYNMWAQAVNDQAALNTNRAGGNSDSTTDRILGLTGTEVNDAQQDLNEGIPMSDDLWDSGDLEVKCIIARSFDDEFYVGDTYDIHGFAGQQYGRIHKQGQVYPVYVFRLKSSPQLEPTVLPDSTPPSYNIS